MLPYYIGEYKSKQNEIDFESAGEVLMKKDDKMVVKGRFEGIFNMLDVKSYTKSEESPRYKEIFNYGFKHIKTDKVDTYILIGCESVELDEGDKLISFWSNEYE